MKQHLSTGLAAAALIAALAGCGGSPGTTTTTPAATSPAATSAAPTAGSPTAAAAVDLKTASSSAGNIVVDSAGISVYFFTKDVKDSGTSACTGACLTAWPPLLTTAAKPAAEGVTGTLGTITTPDGAKQVTLNGLPLYYFAKDKNPGDVLGQGVNDVWYLATPAGELIRTAASSY
ncbi:COG4315 family predicted lipoprotein [Pseudarthrobacter sp. MDT3-1]